jgi:hypothetical protein
MDNDRDIKFDHYLHTYQILMISDNVEFLRIVVAILKMAAGRNLSMSGINSGHHYLPTYQILMISDNVEFLQSSKWIMIDIQFDIVIGHH